VTDQSDFKHLYNRSRPLIFIAPAWTKQDGLLLLMYIRKNKQIYMSGIIFMNSINIVNYKNGFTAVILKLLRPGKILQYTNGSNKPLGYCKE